MPHAHQESVGRPGGGLEVAGEILDDQRVVANRRERRRNAGEEFGTVVVDEGHAAVHRFGREHHLAPEQLAQPLVAEAHAEHGEFGFPDDAGTDPEVAFPVRPAGAGGDDDVVEVGPGDRTPLHVVVHDRRRFPVHLGQQGEQVVGEGVVIVDQQRPGTHHDSTFADGTELWRTWWLPAWLWLPLWLPLWRGASSTVSALITRSSSRHVSAMRRS